MAGRHIKALLAAHRDRDDLAFRRAAQALIEEEESKRHTALAMDLRRLLASGSSEPLTLAEVPLPEPPRDRDSALPLVDVDLPGRYLADLVLEDRLNRALADTVSEVARWSTFDAMGVARRNRILLYGPPGCGKTSIAHALAGSLGRLLVTVRVDTLISSYLGETASNLRRVMDFAATGAYVVLFDEFDSLGKDRDDPADHGELRRVVNAVLQLIDAYRGPSLIIAATNHDHILDSAVWRRFDEVLEVPLPDEIQIGHLITRLLRGRTDGDVDIKSLASVLVGTPHAAAEYAVNAAFRNAILDERTKVGELDLVAGLGQATGRRWS